MLWLPLLYYRWSQNAPKADRNQIFRGAVTALFYDFVLSQIHLLVSCSHLFEALKMTRDHFLGTSFHQLAKYYLKHMKNCPNFRLAFSNLPSG